ncbi:interferon gamma [Tiliqua scincoides]|uniref:interferon gamma n=1 Tax=Tiliqua scincoides TaxID=71010 RepID=UPI0034632DE2
MPGSGANKTHAVVEGGSIFIQKLNSSLWAEANEKKILLGQLISMYSELLKTIFKNKRSKHVKDIIAALEVYKTHYSDGMKKAEELLQLAKLPMNDAKIELKAIMELRTVLLEMNKEEVRRKRRSRAQNPRGRPNLSG